jgi:hypothetical protein
MSISLGVLRKSFLGMVMASATMSGAGAAEAAKGGLEDALNAAMQSKRGITMYVNGQTIGGAVTRFESGSYVELRNQEFGRIVIRWERIDGVALP